MSLLRVFLRHELTTQLRSGRFRGLALIYLVVATAPAVVVFLLTRRAEYVVGSAAFVSFIDDVQPLFTTILIAILSVDAILREREENSLAVVSLAPMSAAGYVLRRWLAVVLIVAPLTILPRVIAAALAAAARGELPPWEPFVYGWLFYVAPPLLIASALAIALGTITGRTVLAVVFATILFTAGQGIANDLLAYIGRRFDGPWELFGMNTAFAEELSWALRGWITPPLPSDAGYDVRSIVQTMLPNAALTFAIAALLLGVSALYLRRTRADLRPWRIPEDHQLRSFLRLVNRWREEYRPDAGVELADRVVLGVCIVAAVVSVTLLVRRDTRFIALATERFSAETAKKPAEMPVTIVPVSATIDGTVDGDGRVRARTTLTLRNNAGVPRRNLSFQLNPLMKIDRMEASRGTARKAWQWGRVDLALDPPLAPTEVRTLTFDVSGTPGWIHFPFQRTGTFQTKYKLYQRAETTIDLADLSRSTVNPAVTRLRMLLNADDFTLVPRYSPWHPSGRNDTAFADEKIAPPMRLELNLRVPEGFVASDACGRVSSGRAFASRCRVGLADYAVFGAPLTTTPLGSSATLAYIPAHAELARTHAPALADALEVARESWPGLAADRSVFVERPTGRVEQYNRYFRRQAMRGIASYGRMHLVPELMFIHHEPIERGMVAAAIVSNHLRQRRSYRPEQEAFFRTFFETVANTRIAGKTKSPVWGGIGPRPDTTPILDTVDNPWYGSTDRLAAVLAEIEYRVGADRLVAGINDFLGAGPKPGTAKELLDAIGRRGGVSLDRVYRDYFLGEAMPRLTLEKVEFRRVGETWEVRGALRNKGDGEVFCPVIVRSDGGSSRTVVRVDTKSSTPFVLTLKNEPRTLQIDPDKVIYRHAAIGLVDSIDYRGQS